MLMLREELDDLSNEMHKLMLEDVRNCNSKFPSLQSARMEEIRKRKIEICKILHINKNNLETLKEESDVNEQEE